MSQNQETWKAETLRLTLFTNIGEWQDHLNWQSVAGSLPDNRNTNVKQGITEEIGEVDGNIMVLKFEPGRINLQFVTRMPSELDSLTEVPSMGLYIDAVKSFFRCSEVLLNLVRELPSFEVYRMAIGSVVLMPVATREEGYILLDGLLPFVQLDPDSSDFNYSINRRRKSSVFPDLEINRLSKWQVRHFYFVVPGVKEISFYAPRIELDINSVPVDGNKIDSGSYHDLLAEFRFMAEEILVNGDVK